MCSPGAAGPIPTATSSASTRASSRSITPGYCKPDVDEILNKSRSTRDPAERRKLFEQLAAIALKDRPIVYLYHRHWLWAYTTKLSGLRTIPDGLIRVQGLKFN